MLSRGLRVSRIRRPVIESSVPDVSKEHIALILKSVAGLDRYTLKGSLALHFVSSLPIHTLEILTQKGVRLPKVTVNLSVRLLSNLLLEHKYHLGIDISFQVSDRWNQLRSSFRQLGQYVYLMPYRYTLFGNVQSGLLQRVSLTL